MICTSEVEVSLTIDDTRYLNEIIHDLKKYGTVSVDLDMCIVCVVGDMDWTNCGYESKVLEAVKDIPVRMVSYGGSNYNISLLVREEDKAATLRSLSKYLFE
jgi:aspartate kinase